MMNKSIKIQEKRKKKLKSFMDGVENTPNLTPLSLYLTYVQFKGLEDFMLTA